jgi:hypothetical protein
MDETKALSIVSALADGVNPLTGEVFPQDSPYQTADVVRALFLVVRMLERRPKPRSRASTADNAGKPWSSDEDRRLLTQFDEGMSVPDLARNHLRTVAGIQARLERHGRITPAMNGSARRFADSNGRSRTTEVPAG